MPAHGFINAHWTERDRSTMQVLTEWRAAALPLANHGWSHCHLALPPRTGYQPMLEAICR